MVGFDYMETFSSVVKFGIAIIILRISISFNWPLRKINVSNAFLNRNITEEVYIYQVVGFVDKEHPTHVCKLYKFLYGLKQAPYAWFNKLSGILIGFVKSKTGDSLFILV